MFRCVIALLVVAVSVVLAKGQSAAPAAGKADAYVRAVREYCDKVLACGLDVYGPKHTPLFVDGVEVETLAPVKWQYRDLTWIPANLANHQNLFRAFVGLSALTGDARYRQAAVEAMRYGIDNLQSSSGLLYWGGHTTYDANSDDWVGRRKLLKTPSPYHEFMNHLPFYQLMWDVDPNYTVKFLGALWSGHVIEWSNLDINRHAYMNKPLPAPNWDAEYVGGPVFYVSKGRSFIPIATDLIHAAATLYRFTGDPRPLVWARRLAHRYVEARDPNTGLSGPIYNHYEDPDRADAQFGDALPGHRVMEATMWSPHTSMRADLLWMMTGQMLGAEGKELTQWALEDLRAVAEVGYDRQRKVFQGMLIDGTNVEKVLKTRSGYFGAKGTPIRDAEGASPDAFCAYALAARISNDAFYWDMARELASAIKLGDIGEGPPVATHREGDPDKPGAAPRLDMAITSTDETNIVALLHLHRMTGRTEYLDQACRIADNVLATKRANGLFVDGEQFRYTRLDSPYALVLLQLAAALTGREAEVPDYWFSASYFACEWKDGTRYSYDYGLYHELRPGAASQPATRESAAEEAAE